MMEPKPRDEAEQPGPRSNREPFFDIVAPNLDGVSRSIFTKGSVSRRRVVRSLIVVGVVIGAIVIIALVGSLFASVM